MRLSMRQLETQLFASLFIQLAYIFEASYSTLVSCVSKKLSVDQLELGKQLISNCKTSYLLFNDYMIINLYHCNSQPTSTSSKFNIKNSRTRSKICSKLKRKTPERHQLTVCSCQLKSVFLFNFGHISDRFLVFFVLSLNKQISTGNKVVSL